MSVAGAKWARGMHTETVAEKCVCWALGDAHHYRTGICEISESEIKRATGLSRRHVQRVLATLMQCGTIHRIRKGKSLTWASRWELVGLHFTPAETGVIVSPVLATPYRAAGDMMSPVYKEEGKTRREQGQNITPDGALTFWLKFKDRLKTEIPDDEWKLWVRPTYLLRALAPDFLLLATPPNNRIMEACQARKRWLQGKLAEHGYSAGFTTYPDEYELDRLVEMNPEWAEVRDRLFRKRPPQRQAG
jgi:hypothetical protein